jgi:hypothetical protein
MSRLDIYRTALLAADPGISGDELREVLDREGSKFPSFVVDHGLGPLWHQRTGRDEFRASRLQAEALFLKQQKALTEIRSVLDGAGIEHVVIKGAANRMLAYDNPAVRACHDLDLLVRQDDRHAATVALIGVGFKARPDTASISFEILLTREDVDVDLHWRLLRDGRLSDEDIDGMLERRREVAGQWMLSANDGVFLLLVHPAFKKHLSSWDMGLHRVADIVFWLETQSFDWGRVQKQLRKNDSKTAAWATLRWVEMLTPLKSSDTTAKMMNDIEPGKVRRKWLNYWLSNDLPKRSEGAHWLRLAAFSLVLHDSLAAVLGALKGRYGAHRRRKADYAEFTDLSGE